MAFTVRRNKDGLLWVVSESPLLSHESNVLHFKKLISSLTHNSWKATEKLPVASENLVNM